MHPIQPDFLAFLVVPHVVQGHFSSSQLPTSLGCSVGQAVGRKHWDPRFRGKVRVGK